MKKILSIIGISFLLTACTQAPVEINPVETKKSDTPPELMEAVLSAKESEKIVELSLQKVINNEKEIILEIVLKNPKQAKIESMRSFLMFNPEIIEGLEININEELKDSILLAPDEDSFDNQNGIMKLGFSFQGNTEDKEELIIASIKFNKLKEGTAIIDFYDVQRGGHTEVLGIFNGHVKNLLKKPQSPALILQNEDEKTN